MMYQLHISKNLFIFSVVRLICRAETFKEWAFGRVRVERKGKGQVRIRGDGTRRACFGESLENEERERERGMA